MEALIYSEQSRLRFKMFSFKALFARNSRSIAKSSNDKDGHFGRKMRVHE